MYGASRVGGASSWRFSAHVAAAPPGAPVAGCNPMTSKDVLSTVQALMAIDAEGRGLGPGRREALEVLGDDATVGTWAASWGDEEARQGAERLCWWVRWKTSGTPWCSRYSDSPSSEGHVEVAK